MVRGPDPYNLPNSEAHSTPDLDTPDANNHKEDIEDVPEEDTGEFSHDLEDVEEDTLVLESATDVPLDMDGEDMASLKFLDGSDSGSDDEEVEDEALYFES
ncbi:hypothetical protein DXG03_005358 [Asterophora parasitica]|uniref:Uncharacterized protein n=1 Tax=Asterophora parasitica TaxID=117018 RepID=A0A9P7G1S1_9AGAR|nr:hypothetical protein DXG03_005358 [Asterophora parasitica]